MTSGEFYRGRGTPPSSPPATGGTWPEPVPTLRAGLTPGKVLPFRRRAVKPQRRRKGKAARLLKPFTTAVLLVGLPVVAAVWLVSSPRFRVAAVEVEGGDSELARWVRERMAPFVGDNLLVLPLSAVSEHLENHPWIESVEISKLLPDHLRVVIHPRLPEALVEADGGLFYADGEGRRIAPVAPDAQAPEAPAPAGLSPDGLLRVRGRGAPRGVPGALSIRRELLAAQPLWGAGVTEVEVLSDEDFRLHTTALPFPLLLRAGDVEPKVRDLEALLPQLLDQYGELSVVDLRFERRIIVEPKSPRSGERDT